MNYWNKHTHTDNPAVWILQFTFQYMCSWTHKNLLSISGYFSRPNKQGMKIAFTSVTELKTTDLQHLTVNLWYIHQASQGSHPVKLVKLAWTHEASPLLPENEIVIHLWSLWRLFSNLDLYSTIYRAKRALTRLHVRQGPFVNSSKSFHQNIKAFFKNFFIS